MCNPAAAAVVMGGMKLGEGIMGMQAQKAQRKFEKHRYSMAIKENNRESYEQYAALQEREVQETAAATESIKQASAAAHQARAVIRTQAADRGVAGQSVVSLLDEVSASEEEFVSTIVRNRVWTNRQLQRNADAIRGETYQKILGALPTTPEPNWVNTLFGTAQGAASGYLMGQGFAK